MTTFKFLTGDVNWLQYGAKWISQKLNNGEFDYWLVLELINMLDATGEIGAGKYNVSLSAVSPDQAGETNMRKAFGSCGWTGEEDFARQPECKVECLHGYGIFALLWQGNGSNAHKLLKEARQQAQVASMMFGFYMDTPKNRIGTTGWEAINGDLDSALHRTIASGSTEGRILAKMHGLS